jgi:TetR/AcrR family transcriptional repressor of nem operon
MTQNRRSPSLPRPANPIIRARLLRAGRDLIHSSGFNASGVQDITAKAGVPKGSFYNYFESKEALIAEILEEYWRTIDERYGPILLNARLKPLTRIKRFFEGLARDNHERGISKGCLIGNMALELSETSEPVRAKIAAIVEAWERALAACLQEAQQQGDIPRGRNTNELAELLVESYEGAVMRAKIERCEMACDRFVQRVLPHMLEA